MRHVFAIPNATFHGGRTAREGMDGIFLGQHTGPPPLA